MSNMGRAHISFPHLPSAEISSIASPNCGEVKRWIEHQLAFNACGWLFGSLIAFHITWGALDVVGSESKKQKKNDYWLGRPSWRSCHKYDDDINQSQSTEHRQ